MLGSPRSLLINNVRRPLGVLVRRPPHNVFPIPLIRCYSEPAHAHGHAHKVVPQEAPLYSKEYYTKYFGHLNDPKNKPEDLWTLSAVAQPLVLECLAELSASEFKMGKLDGKGLLAKYKEQLVNFNDSRKPALEKAGISARIISHLHDIYKFRSTIPLWEVEQAVHEIGFLKRDPNYRVTFGEGNHFPTWKAAKAQFFSATPFNPAFDGKTSINVKRTNAEEALANVKFFRGVRGLMKAIAKGLDDKQKDHILSICDKNLSPADLSDLTEKIALIKKAAATSQSEARKVVEQVLAGLQPGSTKRAKFAELVLADDTKSLDLAPLLRDKNLPALSVSQSPSDVKARLDTAVRNASATKDPVVAKRLEKLSKAFEFFSSPEQHKEMKVLGLLTRTPLTQREMEELVAPFEDKADSDELLNDVLNPHPLAARLLGERMRLLSSERVEYSQSFSEGADTNFHDVHTSPAYENHFKSSAILDNPTPVHPPYNTALEEIYTWKLERLANEIYQFDLNTDLGIAQFDYLVNNYEISPGDATLDKVHSYPPPAHTYEELPIIKFDGYDPLGDHADQNKHH